MLGTQLAFTLGGAFHGAVFFLGLAAVILIMLSTYHAGEYFDFREDAISQSTFKSRFAGGSGLKRDSYSPRVPFWTSIISLILAGIIGVLLQFYYGTGRYTLLLGLAGALPGFFYSTPPLRLVEKGIGELFIGFCYGWLPVAVSYYIQIGHIAPFIHGIGVAIGATIFNVILLNEFPDYPGDRATGKRNLLVRWGKKKGAAFYLIASLLSWVATLSAPLYGVPSRIVFFFVPVMALSIWINVMLIKRRYDDLQVLEVLCGLNIVVNLATTASFMLAFL
ncbi:MAG: prenyltransferase [Smithellaceae bacterium]|nr:prenyltransferase [Smithellaceae bacterium]